MRNRFWNAGLAAAVGCSLLFGNAAAWAEDLVIIIGNERYDGRPRVSDAGRAAMRTLQAAYEREGFAIMRARDIKGEPLRGLLADFETRAKNADRVVVHYAGHLTPSAMNLRLVPRDLSRDRTVVRRSMGTVSLDVLYEILAHRPGKSALILATPLQDVGQGIARGPHIPNGLLVMAGPTRKLNQVVVEEFLGDGASAAALQRAHGDLTIAGYVSDEAFLARPEDSGAADGGSLDRDNDAFAEMSAWRQAAQTGTHASLRDYLKEYPNGMFAHEAASRLSALGPEVSVEEQIEKDLNLTRSQRRQIQENLTLLGFDTRGVDGIFGNGTRRAIASWQRSERFRDSGFLDQVQIRVLANGARDKKAELERQAEAEKIAREREDLDYWRRTGASGDEDDLNAYLERYPDGLFAAQARRLLIEIGASRVGNSNAEAEAVEAKLGLNSRTRRIVEQRLAALDLDPGPVDGTFDHETRRAIAEFQRRRDLDVTGYLTNQTVGQLIASVFGR